MVRIFKISLLTLFCCVAAGQVLWTGAEAQDQPAEKFFKNIKALKGVPAGQIAGLMDAYNKALGVSCEYCHASGNLADDSKPTHKSSVRDITMTREINDKYKHSVDCMSCHQGKPKPTGGLVAKGPTGPTTTGPTTTGPTTTGPTTTGPGKGKEPAKDPGKDKPPASGGGEPPTKVSYAANFSGATKVMFPHDTHMNLDCTKCHHTGENTKCDGCHLHNKKASAVTQVTFYQIAHGTKSERSCTACHQQMKAGPSKCGECHKK